MFLIALTLSNVALAQTGGPDPDYVHYVQVLEAIGDLPIDPGHTAIQLDRGTVSLLNGTGGTEVAIGDIYKLAFGHYTEEFYFHDNMVFDPGAAFKFQHHGPENLAAIPADGGGNQYIHQDVRYTQSPDPGLTEKLTDPDHVDHWSFDIVDNGFLVGKMHREFHHEPNSAEEYFEHWAFSQAFVKPSEEGDELNVILSASQPATTKAWFDSLGPGLTGFSQIRYRVTGYPN